MGSITKNRTSHQVVSNHLTNSLVFWEKLFYQISLNGYSWFRVSIKRVGGAFLNLVDSLTSYIRLHLTQRKNQELWATQVPFLNHFTPITAQKNFLIKEFFSKCDQIRSFLRVWSNLLMKSLMENFIFCAVCVRSFLVFSEGIVIEHCAKQAKL